MSDVLGNFPQNQPENNDDVGTTEENGTEVLDNEVQHAADVDSAPSQEDELDHDPVTTASNLTNFSGGSDIAGVVANRSATEEDDEPNGTTLDSAIISETGEVAFLNTPLNNRDIIDPSADNRHPRPEPRPPLHVYLDESPDKPDDDENLLKASDFEVAAVDLRENNLESSTP